MGKFADNNNKQTFIVNYTNTNSQPTTYDFTFVKIKSLLTANPFSQIYPTPSSITAQLCQAQSSNISFSNVAYGNPWEAPPVGYGSIINYQYLLPSGWQLNSNISNGTTWLSGNNNVTVTPDLTTGNATSIRIRPVNSACGTGLATGQEAYVAISRPSPSLSITGSETMCYPSSYTYTLNGVPSGATISWGNTNSYYNVSASGNTATVTPTSAANGSTTINAVVTLSCGLSFPVSATINIGAPYVTFNISSYPYQDPGCYEVWGTHSFQAQQVTGYPNTYTGFEWGWRNLTNNTVSTDPTIYGSQYTFIPYDPGTYEVWVRATNSCGTSALESVKTITVSYNCFYRSSANYQISTYPNPARDVINLKVTVDSKAEKLAMKNKIVVELFESLTAKKVKEWKFDSFQTNYSLNIQGLKKGTYFLRYINGKETNTKQVLVE